MELADKRIVVAGGSSGIGLTAAKLMAKEGAEVIITARDISRLKTAVDHNGFSKLSTAVNAADRKELNRFFSQVGSIDHLVITLSGGKGAGLFKTLDLEDVKSGFEGKFWPQLNCLQSALPFISSEGSVTLITAVSATSRKPGFSGLAAINGGLEAMVPVLAKELKPLRINTISPGVVDTSWWDTYPASTKEKLFKQFAAETPAQRIGQPKDVAMAIVSVIKLNYLTGRVLQIDGGFGL